MRSLIACVMGICICLTDTYSHGTLVSPPSRVYRVYQSNPEKPDFQLAANAIQMDSKNAYYTWNQVSQNIPEAVQAGLPEGFDYSPWVPDGQIASGGRVDPNIYGELTYSGLDQVSADWPSMVVTAGEIMDIDFFATAVHEPSTWDFWLTTEDWDPNTALTWDQMEFMGRQDPVLDGNHYLFEFEIPADRSGHHVLWVAWQRDDSAGEVYFTASDLSISNDSEPCSSESLVLDEINAALYHAIQSIVCSAQISSPADITLKAGDNFELLAPFSIGEGIGADFSIEGCQQLSTKKSGSKEIPIPRVWQEQFLKGTREN